MSIKEICRLFLVFRSLSTVTQEIRDPQLLKRLLHWCTTLLMLPRRENKLEKDALNFFAVVSSVIDQITFFIPLLVFLFSGKQIFLSWLTGEGVFPIK
jgi:hypothetical protein